MATRWQRNSRATRLALLNLGAIPPSASAPSRQVTPGGVAYDLYQPEGRAESTHVMLYGMDYAGEEDSRLVRLAYSYARLGIRAVVPVLPGLKSFRVDSSDLDRLCELTRFLSAQLDTPIRFTGFSIGGGYGLVAAAQPDLADKVDLLLLFSPPHSLDILWDTVKRLERPDRADQRAWESFIMGRTAVAYRQLDRLGLTEAEQAEFLELMRHYCTRKTEVADFYERALADRELPAFSSLKPDAATMERLSPAGKLHRVRARVLILHDPGDPTSPAEGPRRIMAELPERTGAGRHRLLITPLLSHVDLQPALRIGDAMRALSIVGEIFA